MKKYCIIATMICFGLSLTTSVIAEESAKELFDKGVAALDAKDYAAALAAFEKAYKLSPHHAVLPHIGTCHSKLGSPIEALRSFEKYLETGGAQITNEEKETAREMIQAERKKIGVLVLEVSKTGAEAKVDGKSIGTAPFEKTMLMPGQHEVSVRFSDQNIVTRSFSLQAGEELLVRIKEDDGATAKTPGPTPPPEAAESDSVGEDAGEEPLQESEPIPEEEPQKTGSYVPAIISGVVAAVGLVAGGVGLGLFFYYNQSAENYKQAIIDQAEKLDDDEGGGDNYAAFEYDSTCEDRIFEPDESDVDAKIWYCNTEYNRRRMARWKTPAFAVGVAGAGLFGLAMIPTILFIVKKDWFGDDVDQTASFSVSPIIAPDQKGLVLSLTF